MTIFIMISVSCDRGMKVKFSAEVDLYMVAETVDWILRRG